MANYRRDAEYSLPPPEISDPGREFRFDPATEYTPLPPEYGQRTTEQPPEPKKKRGLRKLLAAPAVLLLSFVLAHAGGSVPGQPTPNTPGYVKPSTVTADLPRGDVVIDVIDYYTGLEGDTVNYRYQLYLRGADEVFGEVPYPVTVYADVTDGEGNTTAVDPDTWTGARSLDEHSIDVSGLKDNLLLRLRAVYTQDDEERQTTVYLPFVRHPGIDGFRVKYAELDLETRIVSFDYWVDRQAPILIVPVNATVIDSQGRTAHPPVNPIDWSSGPMPEDSKWADATDLNNDLTLLLEVRYEMDGVEYRNMAAYPVSIKNMSDLTPDYQPDTNGSITNITKTDVSFSAQLRTTYLTGSHYDMTVSGLYLVWLDEDGKEVTRDYLSTEDVKVDREYSREMSPPWGEWPQFNFSFSGRHWFYDDTYTDKSEFIGRESAVYAELTAYNKYTGHEYVIKTDPVPKPVDSYPLGDGEIVLTVYNDTLTSDFPSVVSGGYLTVLAQQTISESSFSTYKLPAAKTPGGYDFAGWVIHVGNPFDDDTANQLYDQYSGDPPVDELLTEDSFAFAVGDTLTKEDIERVPTSADGKRYVNVHAAWISQDKSSPRLYLDDGHGSVHSYGMDVPLASEGFLYLCRYPEPTRDAWVFDGWYDESGKRVDMLCCYFSFTEMTYDAEGNFTGYDWSTKNTVTLTARWK